jgi:hypothetical protein
VGQCKATGLKEWVEVVCAKMGDADTVAEVAMRSLLPLSLLLFFTLHITLHIRTLHICMVSI